jgi:hypothetical protein
MPKSHLRPLQNMSSITKVTRKMFVSQLLSYVTQLYIVRGLCVIIGADHHLMMTACGRNMQWEKIISNC